MTNGSTLVETFIDGRPKTKGSMRHLGDGRMVEQVQGSSAWKQRVARHLRAIYHAAPYDSAVVLGLVFVVPKAARPADPRFPSSKRTGDIDKLARNILDALVTGKVLRDDSRVVRLVAEKRYPDALLDEPTGVHIRLDRS